MADITDSAQDTQATQAACRSKPAPSPASS